MSRWWRFATLVLVVALAWVVATNWQSASGAFIAAGASLLIVVPLGLLGLLAGAASWAVLQRPERRWRAFRAFLMAQPAKYLPGGGFLQAAGQVTMSATRPESAGAISVSFGVHTLLHIAAGVTVSLLVAVQATEASVLLLVGGSVLVGLFFVLLNDPIYRRLIGLLRRFERLRLEDGELTLSRRARYASWLLTTIPLSASGIIFYIMLGGAFGARDLAYTVGVFAAAWVAGFLFFLVPVGLGIRESALVLLLGDLPATELIAVSAAHRALMLAIEATVALVAHVYQQRKSASRR